MNHKNALVATGKKARISFFAAATTAFLVEAWNTLIDKKELFIISKCIITVYI